MKPLKTILSLLICFVLNSQTSFSQEFSGKVHLVALGVNDYGNEFYNLVSAEKDAQNFSKRLKEEKEIIEINEYIFLSDATKEQILNAFNEIGKQSAPNDVFIFSSSSQSTNKGQIILSDMSKISANELFFASQNILCTDQLFFIDACYGDSFLKDFQGKLSKNPNESTMSNTNRIILSINGKGYETDRGGYFSLSYTENPNLNILDVFSDSKEIVEKFKKQLYSFTETLFNDLRNAMEQVDPAFKIEVAYTYFSEAEFASTNLKETEMIQEESSGSENNTTNSDPIPEDNSSIEPTTETNDDVPRRGAIVVQSPNDVNNNPTVIKKGETLCFVVGCNEFTDFNKLANPINDASSIKHILEKDYLTKVIYLENPSSLEFRKELMGIRTNYTFEEGSQFMFFAATHGSKDESNVGQMIFSDSYYEFGLLQKAYALSSIKRAISQFECTNSLIVLDICHSGTMFDDGSCNQPSAVEIPLDSPIFKTSGPQSPAYKNFLTQKTNLFISSSADQEASDGTGDHSPFATVVISFLEENPLEVIDSYHLENEIKTNVMRLGSISVPMFCSYASKDDGRFLFIKK